MINSAVVTDCTVWQPEFDLHRRTSGIFSLLKSWLTFSERNSVIVYSIVQSGGDMKVLHVFAVHCSGFPCEDRSTLAVWSPSVPDTANNSKQCSCNTGSQQCPSGLYSHTCLYYVFLLLFSFLTF